MPIPEFPFTKFSSSFPFSFACFICFLVYYLTQFKLHAEDPTISKLQLLKMHKHPPIYSIICQGTFLLIGKLPFLGMHLKIIIFICKPQDQ